MSNEIEKLTEEFLGVKNQMRGLEIQSVPLAIERGRILTLVKERLPHGRWEEWCAINCDGKSMSTVKRWVRVYNRSLVTDLSKMTLDEIYESMKKKKVNGPPQPKDRPKTYQGPKNPVQPNDLPKTDDGSADTTQDKPQSTTETELHAIQREGPIHD